MQRRAIRTVALIHRLLAASFIIVGLIFLCAPNGTVRFINAAGAVFRVFPPAPQSELRIWLSLGFGYMVLVTILALRIAADPRRQRALMPILAAGKLASSLTCLLFFVAAQPAFLYLLNAVVDGTIVVIVMACYVWLATVEHAAARATLPAGEVARLLSAVTATMVPANEAIAMAAGAPRLDAMVWLYFGSLHLLGTVALTVMLYLVEYAPYLFGPRRCRFSRLSPGDRQKSLEGWEASRLVLRRQLLNGLKLAVTLHAYDVPAAAAAVGYDESYVRGKLLAGPNAEWHRERLA